MLIEWQKRLSRVRFRHPIRVVTLEGQPRVIRTLTANVSSRGLFLRMPEPLPLGTKVALSLEAGGRALALAQAEVVWGQAQESPLPGRFPGCGVRFTEFMHPRGQELVDYLVHNLDRGKPLLLAPPERPWTRWLPIAGGAALLGCAALAAFLLWAPAVPAGVHEEAPPAQTIEFVAAPPTVHPVEAAAPRPEPTPVVPDSAAAPAEEPLKAEAAPVDLPAPAPEVKEVAAVEAPAEVAPPALTAAKSAKAESAPGKAATVAPASGAGPVQKGSIKLPSGAAPSLAWTLGGRELRLSPELPGQAQVTRAFVLAGPPRAVFDISGAPPSRSQVVPASPPYATAVRLGKQPSGTRIVVDLHTAPKRSRQDGAALVLSF